mmetsp:Transcript_63935/g.76873  ORF Transcript_63935/g.76873 Transcript_63935/m.76873 type:complete len:132 (-) Transcript_63935:277-672(-)
MKTALALASMAAPRIIRALSSSSSSFQPPIPPTSAAQSIYENIDFGKKLSNKNAEQRNADPDAVFVINGSSRGIGLQFVKSLYVCGFGLCHSAATGCGRPIPNQAIGDNITTGLQAYRCSVQRGRCARRFH